MKKLFFSVIALMCFSISGFANETEPVKPLVSVPIENVVQKPDWCVSFTFSYVKDDPDPNDTNLAEIVIIRFTYCSE